MPKPSRILAATMKPTEAIQAGMDAYLARQAQQERATISRYMSKQGAKGGVAPGATKHRFNRETAQRAARARWQATKQGGAGRDGVVARVAARKGRTR